MNKRILEFAEHCTTSCVDGRGVELHEIDVEKFAELILTEVISTIYRSDISDKKQEKLVDELAYKFGMK